jgi:N6-L-threonylcarbamoyladenine synthase
MIILGIETSCDETAAAVVENGTKVLINAVHSSLSSHVKSGGIIPEVAARRQIESIIPVIEKSIKRSKGIKSINNIDAIAVTYGPGLIGSLLVGVETAKTLSLLSNKPLIPVNHLVAHIYANWIPPVIPTKAGMTKDMPQFPAVALVVSGGHTDFVLMKDHGDISYLGGTRDDAAGEAFDKTARLLGLPYPGGPAIAEAAGKHLSFLRKQESIQIINIDSGSGPGMTLFPRPMIDSGDLDLSFSGLKTAVLNYTKENKDFDRNQLAAEIQEAIDDTLVSKSVKAVEEYNPKSFILAGGVSSNKRLRIKIKKVLKSKTEVFIPDPKYSTDNAVMVAAAAFYNYNPVPWEKITANPSLSIED